MARDTRTGAVLENMIVHALEQGGYQYKKQVYIGDRLGGGRHKVDVLISSPSDQQILISLKWQQASGTAEQKLPFEVMSLVHSIQNSDGRYKKAYVVLGGNGWKLKQFYLNDGLKPLLNYSGYVTIIELNDFVALANKSRL